MNPIKFERCKTRVRAWQLGNATYDTVVQWLWDFERVKLEVGKHQGKLEFVFVEYPND